MISVAPKNLEAARRLLEVPPTVSHKDLIDDEPVATFIDSDKRLMKVVQDADGLYHKMCME